MVKRRKKKEATSIYHYAEVFYNPHLRRKYKVLRGIYDPKNYQTLLDPHHLQLLRLPYLNLIECYLYTLHHERWIELDSNFLITILEFPVVFPGAEHYLGMEDAHLRAYDKRYPIFPNPGNSPSCEEIDDIIFEFARDGDYLEFMTELELLETPPVPSNQYRCLTPFMLELFCERFPIYQQLLPYFPKDSLGYHHLIRMGANVEFSRKLFLEKKDEPVIE